MRSLIIAMMGFMFFALPSTEAQEPPKDEPYPVELRVGEIFNICESGEIICPARLPICDDPKVAIPIDTPEGLGFEAVGPGSTLCSAQAGAGLTLRRVFRITVKDEH